jgi:hypothetical protein
VVRLDPPSSAITEKPLLLSSPKRTGDFYMDGAGKIALGIVAAVLPIDALYRPSVSITPFQRVANSGMVFARYRQVI